MKRFPALILAALMLTTALCGCGDASVSCSDDPASAADKGTADVKDEKDDSTLPSTYEIAATDPHYSIATPDWKAEGYGCGFALNEKGNKKYAIVMACGAEADAEETSLQEAFATLYNDTFNGILIQNYRAKYAEFTPATAETLLADGSPALLFQDVQPADDYGTQLSCPVYGYGFRHDGVPFIVAYIVIDETDADAAKCAEMQSYVDAMVTTVRTEQ